MKKVLITGFEPFGGDEINPSWECVKRLSSTDDYQLFAVQLPCVFDESLKHLFAETDRLKPDVVICVGQAGGIPDIAIERVAINLNDARIPDNQGNQPIDTQVVQNAPTAYFASLPVKAMLSALHQAGVPAHISLSAGSYVCNHVMFGLLDYLSKHSPNTLGGFIHIPYLPEQGVLHRGEPTMAMETLIKALSIIVSVSLQPAEIQEQVKISGGSLH